VEKLTPFDEILRQSTKICRYLWIRIAKKFAKLHATRLNRSENIRKSFRRGGGYFFETPYKAATYSKSRIGPLQECCASADSLRVDRNAFRFSE